MGANVTIYCLENITDYLQFESLCHDLMALEGYKDIEPLGGFSDKGRDAVHVDKTKNTVFAYSAREDWKIKLLEDASKIRKHGHDCDDLVFITTAEFSASARDQAVREIKEDFGWELKLYGVERLRILLETTHPEVRANHPQIFPPQFLQIEASYQPSEKEHVYIIYSSDDVVFAGWLSQKLLSFGYRVWCDLTSQLSEDFPDDVDGAIENQSAVVLSILSHSALADMEHTRQRGLALRIAKGQNREHLVGIKLDSNLPIDNLDKETKSLRLIDFSSNWGDGLENLQQRMEKMQTPRPLLNGKSLASRAFNEEDVIIEQEENVYLNCFEVIQIPEIIQRFKSDTDIDYKTSKEIQQVWAHRRVDDRTFLSFFSSPQEELINEYNFVPDGGGSTSHTESLDGIPVRNLISELLKKSMYMKCVQMGLQYCNTTGMYYFPFDFLTGNHLTYSRPDGTNTWVGVAGERKYWTPGKEEYYRYYLSPVFYVSQNLYTNYVIMVRVRLRMTDPKDKPLPSKKAFSRRKHLTNDWWNKEWGDRFFAITNFLSDGNEIVIGSKNEQIRINAIPTILNSPIGINEKQLDLLKSQDIRLWAGEIEEEGDDEGEDYEE